MIANVFNMKKAEVAAYYETNTSLSLIPPTVSVPIYSQAWPKEYLVTKYYLRLLIENKTITELSLFGYVDRRKYVTFNNWHNGKEKTTCSYFANYELTEVADVLLKNDTITNFGLHYQNAWEDDGVTALGNALKRNKALTKLSFSFCHINKKIPQLLPRINSLTEIHLCHIWIDEHSLEHLCTILKNNTTLKILDLSQNRISNTASLAKLLEKNSTIEELRLDRNIIGDEGAKYLARALKINLTLTMLDLFDNRIESDGLTDLLSAIKKNSTLLSMNLGYNSFTHDLMDDIGFYDDDFEYTEQDKINRKNHDAIIKKLKRNATLLK